MAQDHYTDGGSRPERRRSSDRRHQQDRRAGLRQGRSRKRGMATLAFLTSLSTLVLALFLYFQSDLSDDLDWFKMPFIKKQAVEAFRIGEVVLGMKPDAVRRKHPNANLTAMIRGESVATFDDEGARYTVWFVSIKGVDKAYRIRYDEVISGKSDTSVVEEIGRRQGKPGTSDCTRAASGGKKCHFQWWPTGGIALNVMISTEKKAGKWFTAITKIATDTYLDGKRIRNQRQ